MKFNNQRQLIGVIIGCLIIISLSLNLFFYSTLGRGTSSILYGALGVSFDVVKEASIVGAFFLATNYQGILQRAIAIGLLFLWAALSCMSIIAAFGGQAAMQEQINNERLKASAEYQNNRLALQAAQEQVASLKQASSGLQQLQEELALAQVQLASAESKLLQVADLQCNPKRDARGAPYRTLAGEACEPYKLASSQVARLQQDLQLATQAQVQLAPALAQVQQLALAGGQSVEAESAAYVGLGKISGKDPSKIKFYLIMMSAIILEVMIFFMTGLLMFIPSHENEPTKDETVKPSRSTIFMEPTGVVAKQSAGFVRNDNGDLYEKFKSVRHKHTSQTEAARAVDPNVKPWTASRWQARYDREMGKGK